MSTLTKRAKRFKPARGLVRPSSLRKGKPEAVNSEALRGIISYLNYLYTDGEISDGAYKALVSQVISTFVENSTEFKIERILDKVLEEAEEALLSDILL